MPIVVESSAVPVHGIAFRASFQKQAQELARFAALFCGAFSPARRPERSTPGGPCQTPCTRSASRSEITSPSTHNRLICSHARTAKRGNGQREIIGVIRVIEDQITTLRPYNARYTGDPRSIFRKRYMEMITRVSLARRLMAGRQHQTRAGLARGFRGAPGLSCPAGAGYIRALAARRRCGPSGITVRAGPAGRWPTRENLAMAVPASVTSAM